MLKHAAHAQRSHIMKMDSSPLNEIIKADVEEVTKSILKDTVEPWIFFGSKGVNIKKIDGSSISISGFEYAGTAVDVFWKGFIDEYIKKKSRDLIESTRVKAIERKISVESALQDCREHLHSMVIQIFGKMAVIDQRLRGKGYPNSVQKKDVQDRIQQNFLMIDALVNSEIECYRHSGPAKSKWLKALELKPNFFGLGINLNWLISRVFRKK